MDFEDFYREHSDNLWRLCYLACLDVEVAADACQEAMLRAWDRWDTLAGQVPLAWVRQVGLNLCRSRWRRAQRELRLRYALECGVRCAPAAPRFREEGRFVVSLHTLPALV